MQELELAEFLYQALNSDYGVEIATDDAERLRQKLYAVRKTVNGFERLSFIISPRDGESLWIVKIPEGTENAEG